MSKLYNLKAGSASAGQLQSGLGAFPGLTRGASYFLDPANGSNSNTGDDPQEAVADIVTAHSRCTSGQNDTVFFIGGATGNNASAAVTWSSSYTHLIGLSGDLPGMGQRCRIVNSATADLATLFTVSGSGNIFKNIQWFDGKDKAEDGANVVVSGSRNYFENCFFAGMGHATPAARAGSESLSVTGSENYFYNCTIGLDTIVRAAANAELRVSGARNTFEKCIILSYSETAGKFLVQIDNSGGDLRWTLFRDCVFINYTVNWATGITNAFDMPASGSTHYVLLQNCSLMGVGTGWADTVTHIYSADAAPNAGFGLATNPTT